MVVLEKNFQNLDLFNNKKRGDTMPAARIHEAVALEINKDYEMDEILLRLGTIAPDCWRNVDESTGLKSKKISHFWDFKVKQGEANNYIEFYLKYYSQMNNPFYFGYLIHLITDQYWKSKIDPLYVENNVWQLKDGTKYDIKNDPKYFDEEENVWNINGGTGYDEKKSEEYRKHFGYYEELKMQKKLAKKYKLGMLPIKQEDVLNLDVNIDELCLDGLFSKDGKKGTAEFVNGSLDTPIADNESIVYDFDKFEKHIEDTVEFTKSELIRLRHIKELDDLRIKIAVDIDDTLLCTEEKKNECWEEFLRNHPDINPDQERTWDNPIIVQFWDEYRERIAFGDIKSGASESMNDLIKKGYRVDLLSARPLDRYAILKQKMCKYFEDKDINYIFLNIGFRSKKDFLKEHEYDILIDNELKHIIEAESVGVIPILYGYNPDYRGYQTNNWKEIPEIIQKIIDKKNESNKIR